MLMKVFPHGTGEGDKPSRYLVRPDYPGRDTAPPQVLRGNPAVTRALIDSIDRRWKFTSGVLSWHPDEKICEEQEEEVMDAVIFSGYGIPMPGIMSCISSFHDWNFPAARISTLVLPAGKKTLTYSATCSTGAKAGRGPTIWHGHGMNFRKKLTCSRREWRDGAGKATVTGPKRLSMLSSRKK